MDPTARILALAPLLWPNVPAFGVGLQRADADITATVCTDGGELARVTAADGVGALGSLAAHLTDLAHLRSVDLLRAAGIDPPPPGPSRDELAARLAECERELADVTRDRDTARRRLTAMRDAVAAIAWTGDVDNDPDAVADLDASAASDLRRITCTLAARVDPQPPRRAAGVGAGVADLIDAEVRHMDFVAGCTESPAIADVCRHLADRLRPVALEARQRAGGGERGSGRVEGAQQGAADVGGVAERVLVAEGVAGAAAAGRRAAGGAR